MQALILERPGLIVLRTLAAPEPGPGELVVKVEAATTCGTDLKAFLRGHPQIPMPGPFGHEYSGIVAKAGKGARFKEGDAVMGVHSAPCQACRWCKGGQENLCETIMSSKVLGSYAQHLLIPERIANVNIFPKPEAVTFEKSSLLEPLACVAQGLLNFGMDRIPEDVLVIGPGSIGLMFVAALRNLGASRVTLAGRNPLRLEIGRKLGASPANLPDLQEQFDLVIECTGSVEVWEKSVDFARRGGTVMLFGGCPKGSHVAYDTSRLHYDQISLLSPFHFGTEAVRTAREWLLDPDFRLEDLISGDRRLEEAEAVFEDLRQGKGIKYVFRP